MHKPSQPLVVWSFYLHSPPMRYLGTGAIQRSVFPLSPLAFRSAFRCFFFCLFDLSVLALESEMLTGYFGLFVPQVFNVQTVHLPILAQTQSRRA